MNRKPPPVLGCNRVIVYAIRTPSIKYSGHSYLLVEGKEVGPVPRLVICRDDNRGRFMLIHCDHRWNALGLSSSDYRTLTEAKARAERIYPGLMRAWRKTGVTRIQAKRYLDKQGQRCGSCDKPWYEVEVMVELGRRGKPKLALCGYCIDELHRQLHE